MGDPSRRLGQPAGPADGASHEDHPIGRRGVEDTIADGADDVTVWDEGTYANKTDQEMTTCLGRGHLSIRLNGEKLHGGYALTRVREGEEETWLLIKRRDDAAPRNPSRIAAAYRCARGRQLDARTDIPPRNLCGHELHQA